MVLYQDASSMPQNNSTVSLPRSIKRRASEPTTKRRSEDSTAFALPHLGSDERLVRRHSSNLTTSQLKALKHAFTWADANYNNTLDKNEVTELLNALGYPCSSKVVENLFQDMDQDGNGVIDLPELTHALGASVAEKAQARRGPAHFSPKSSPASGGASTVVSNDKSLEHFFHRGRFTENVDALFATGITLDMLLEYSYSNARLNTLLESPQTLTGEGKRRIRRMLCATRNARVLDSKNIAIIVNCGHYDDPLMWEHPVGDAVVSVMQDALLMAGYAVHCIGTIHAPATREAVLGSIRAIAATLPHKKHVFARKKIKIVLCIVGNALEDYTGALHLIPQDAMLKDLQETSLSMRDIFNVVPSGVNTALLADFGFVYTRNSDGNLGSQEEGLGLMTTMVDNKWDDVKRLRQPRGGGFFLFNVLDCLALSEVGVSTSDLKVVVCSYSGFLFSFRLISLICV